MLASNSSNSIRESDDVGIPHILGHCTLFPAHAEDSVQLTEKWTFATLQHLSRNHFGMPSWQGALPAESARL